MHNNKSGWFKVFKAQSYNQPTYKHKKLPIFLTKEFDFFRCVEFKEEFYNVLATDLFKGNLRDSSGRYSVLFPDQKISYWAESVMTARAEVKKHGAGCDLLTFWAYDDASSFEPCMGSYEMLYILDGRRSGVQSLIDKVDEGKLLSEDEKELMRSILKEPIDCIAYESKARPGGENFIFLERGFKKLALRQIRLRFGRKNGGSHNRICCATSSDYTPFPKAYGEYFVPKCRVVRDEKYQFSEECIEREKNIEKVLELKFGRRKKK